MEYKIKIVEKWLPFLNWQANYRHQSKFFQMIYQAVPILLNKKLPTFLDWQF